MASPLEVKIGAVFNIVNLGDPINPRVVLIRDGDKNKKGKPSFVKKWKFPGGRVEGNEIPKETAERESKEEIGVSPSNLTWVCDVQIEFPSPHRLEWYEMSLPESAEVDLKPGKEVADIRIAEGGFLEELVKHGRAVDPKDGENVILLERHWQALQVFIYKRCLSS